MNRRRTACIAGRGAVCAGGGSAPRRRDFRIRRSRVAEPRAAFFVGTASVFVVRGERDDDRESRNLLTSRDAGQGDVHVVDLDAKLADRAKCGELSEQAVGRRSAPSGCDRPGLVSRRIRESTTSQRGEGRPDGVPPASLAPRARVRGTRAPGPLLARSRTLGARRGAGRRGVQGGRRAAPVHRGPRAEPRFFREAPGDGGGGGGRRVPRSAALHQSVGRATPRTTSARRIACPSRPRTPRAANWPPPGRAPRPRPRRRRRATTRTRRCLTRYATTPRCAPSGGPSWTRVWRWLSASASARSARKRRRTNLGRRWRSRRTRSTARRRRGTRRRRGRGRRRRGGVRRHARARRRARDGAAREGRGT